MTKDTLRLIMFLDCNFACTYCCNNKKWYSDQFIKKTVYEIDFSSYENVCLTGGEPFLDPEVVFEWLDKIPKDKNVYIYTNGVLITTPHLHQLITYRNLKMINVGLHHKNQINSIHPDLEKFIPVRFLMEDVMTEEIMQNSNGRVHNGNSKQWVRDQCDLPNEDWVLLVEEK